MRMADADAGGAPASMRESYWPSKSFLHRGGTCMKLRIPLYLVNAKVPLPPDHDGPLELVEDEYQLGATMSAR